MPGSSNNNNNHPESALGAAGISSSRIIINNARRDETGCVDLTSVKNVVKTAVTKTGEEDGKEVKRENMLSLMHI